MPMSPGNHQIAPGAPQKVDLPLCCLHPAWAHSDCGGNGAASMTWVEAASVTWVEAASVTWAEATSMTWVKTSVDSNATATVLACARKKW
jgi:hypothetical protein